MLSEFWKVVSKSPVSSLVAAVAGSASIFIVWQSNMSRAGTDFWAGVVVAVAAGNSGDTVVSAPPCQLAKILFVDFAYRCHFVNRYAVLRIDNYTNL